MVQINAYNLYSISGFVNQDEIETFKSKILNIGNYNDVIEYLKEKYDFSLGEKEISFKNNSKSVLLAVDSELASFSILDNGKIDDRFIVIKN